MAIFKLKKNTGRTIGARSRGGPPLALALLYSRLYCRTHRCVVLIVTSGTGVFFFDKKTTLK